ncbi:carbonic anhydrase, partial [Phenoliferia sp. Uapishka_3]
MANYHRPERHSSEGANSFSTWNDFQNQGEDAPHYSASASQMLLNDVAPPPIVSKDDWGTGEGIQEYQNNKKRRKAKMKAEAVATNVSRGVKGWFKKDHRGVISLFAAFAFFVALGITLYFVVPRAPGVAWGSLSSDDSDPQTSNTNATFSWNANLTLIVDSSSSYVPLEVKIFEVEVSLLSSGAQIGTGSMHTTVPGRSLKNVTVPILFSGGPYVNYTDVTYAAMLDSCGPSGEFGVVRNAGGRVAHVTSEIAFVSAATELDDIIVVQHTDCGLFNMKNSMLRKKLADKGLGNETTVSWDFGEINDLDQSVKDDVAELRKSPYVSPKTNVRGYILDLMTSGRLREVQSLMGENK